MRSRAVKASLAFVVALGLAACSNDSSPEPEPEFTLGVKPAREVNSPAQTKSTSSVGGTIPFEGEWFSLQVPQDAELVNENESMMGDDSFYGWILGDYEITAYRGPVEAYTFEVENVETDNVAHANLMDALVMLDGGEATTIEAGELQGWDADGYYLMQEYPEAERRVTYYLSTDEHFIRLEVVNDTQDIAPYDFMNTFDLKDN